VFLWTVMVRPGEVPERASRKQHRLPPAQADTDGFGDLQTQRV
jgi:hypothetical protein